MGQPATKNAIKLEVYAYNAAILHNNIMHNIASEDAYNNATTIQQMFCKYGKVFDSTNEWQVDAIKLQRFVEKLSFTFGKPLHFARWALVVDPKCNKAIERRTQIEVAE